MDPIKTGKVISEARKSHGLRQKDLARQIGVSDKAVSKWERGLSFPDITVLIPLSETLGVSLYDLLKGENMNTKDKNVKASEQLNDSAKLGESIELATKNKLPDSGDATSELTNGAVDAIGTATEKSKTPKEAIECEKNAESEESVLKSAIEHYSDESKRNRTKMRISWAAAIVVLVIVIAVAAIYGTKMKARDMANIDWQSAETSKLADYMNDSNYAPNSDEFEVNIASELPLAAYNGVLSLGGSSKSVEFRDNQILMSYNADYSEMAEQYLDESRVKYLMIYSSVVLFTLCDDVDSAKFVFNDASFTATRDSLSSALGIEDYSKYQDETEFAQLRDKIYRNENQLNEIFSKAFSNK